MAVNKIIFDNFSIDLTEDTITADRLYSGFTAHDRYGNVITGTLNTAPIEPIEYDYNIGYVTNGAWVYENPTRTYTDIYEIISGHPYIVTLGANVGSRFRAMTTATDIRTITSGRVTGVKVVDKNNPVSYDNAKFTADVDGYLLVAKDNVGTSGIFSYVYDGIGWI